MTDGGAVGIFWFEAEDWQRWMEILEDADALPGNYFLWLAAAELREHQITMDSGMPVYRALVSPDEFLEWVTASAFHRPGWAARSLPTGGRW